MKIRTVLTTSALNTAGQVVESRPVRDVAGPVLNTAGQLVLPVVVEESAAGIPVRYVTDAVVLNSVGQPVAATPVIGGGVPAGFAIVRTDGLDLLQTGGQPVTFNGKRVLTDGRDLYLEAA